MKFDGIELPYVMVEATTSRDRRGDWLPVAGPMTYTPDGGTTFADATSRVISVNTKRGKENELDDFPIGTATITIDNPFNVVDPTVTTQWSSYKASSGNVLVGKMAPNFAALAGEYPVIVTGSAFGEAATMFGNRLQVGIGGSPGATCSFSWTYSTTIRTPVTADTVYTFVGRYAAHPDLEVVQYRMRFFTSGGTFISSSGLSTDQETEDVWNITALDYTTTAMSTARLTFKTPSTAAYCIPEVVVTRSSATGSAFSLRATFDGWRIFPGYQAIIDTYRPNAILVPGRNIRVWAMGSGTPFEDSDYLTRRLIFMGRIEDVNIDWGVQPTVTLSCVDYLQDLGAAYTKYSNYGSGQTITERWKEVCIYSSVDLTKYLYDDYGSSSGGTICQITSYGGTLLQFAQRALRGGNGYLFCSNHDHGGLRARYGPELAGFYNGGAAPVVTFSDTVNTTTDDAAGKVEFNALTSQIGQSKIRNSVTIQMEQNANYTAAQTVLTIDVNTDDVILDPDPFPNSINLYGPRNVNVETMNDPNATGLGNAYFLAVAIRDRLKNRPREITSVTVDMVGHAQTWRKALAVDIFDLAAVERNFGFGGTFITAASPSGAAPVKVLVTGIEHTITADAWSIRFNIQRPYS